MTEPAGQDHPIRLFVLDQVLTGARDVVPRAAETFDVSRQAVQRHVDRLLQEGRLVAEGRTRARVYRVEPTVARKIPITVDSSEDLVWRESLAVHIRRFPKNVQDICLHGFSEMFNNVIDHSEADEGAVLLYLGGHQLEIRVEDNGVGIFNKLQRDLGLEDARHAALELSKGKLTTDQEAHSGEGIFFTKLMFDFFLIWSGTTRFGWVPDSGPTLTEDHQYRPGTTVRMVINSRTKRTTQEVFDEFAPEDFAFTRTTIVVELARHEGVELVSRSQARRLLARCEEFEEVLLDFSRIETIGRAFADEVFRVYPGRNPSTAFRWENASVSVEKMIQQVRSRL